MSETLQTDKTELGVRLLDDAHFAWFAAAVDCEQALHAWFAAARPDGASRYLAYRAALDREEAAASDLERLCVSGAR